MVIVYIQAIHEVHFINFGMLLISSVLFQSKCSSIYLSNQDKYFPIQWVKIIPLFFNRCMTLGMFFFSPNSLKKVLFF